MARPTTTGGAEVALHYNWDGQQCENVLHFLKPTDWDVADLQTLADDVIDWWTSNMAVLATTTCSLVEVVATDLSSPTGPQFVDTNTLPIVGGAGGSSQPNNVTVAVAHLTASRGRSFRGRSYVVGLSTAEVNNSQLNSGVPAIFQTAFRALRDFAFGVADTQWAVLSEVTAGAPRANGIMTPILDVSVDGTLDSQRRRLPGRGR